MQGVEVHQAREGRLQPCQRVAGFEQRHVKRFAVVGYEPLAGSSALRQRLQDGFFLRIISQEELPDHELHAFHSANADQERTGARAAGQAGGFRVEKNQPRRLGRAVPERAVQRR